MFHFVFSDISFDDLKISFVAAAEAGASHADDYLFFHADILLKSCRLSLTCRSPDRIPPPGMQPVYSSDAVRPQSGNSKPASKAVRSVKDDLALCGRLDQPET
jgi:hypothetical protein